MKNTATIHAFGAHVKNLREARELSQQDLADNANISKATVQRIEQAKFSVTLDVLVSLATGLGMPLHEMMHLPE